MFSFFKKQKRINKQSFLYNHDNAIFVFTDILEIVKKEFRLDLYGLHGINHWERVFLNTQKLSKYYNIESDIFELFALLHDSQRFDDYADLGHGQRAKKFTKSLIEKGTIKLNKDDQERLLYACENHTKPNKKHKLYNDLIVQICLDSDKMDIGRVGVIPDEKYFLTDYAKELIKTYNKSLRL